MNQRQAKPNGYPSKSDRCAFRGRADDDVYEEEGRDDFTQKARYQTVLSGAEIAIAVGRKPTSNPFGFAGGDNVEYRSGHDRPGHLCEDVGKNVGGLEAASGPESYGNGKLKCPPETWPTALRPMSLGSSLVLNCTNERREYRPACAAGDRL